MFELTIARQRGILLAAQIALLAALIVAPLYVGIGAVCKPLQQALQLVPGLCAVTVIAAAAASVLVEQTTANDEIRAFTQHQINIFLLLVFLGLLSATQASAWWRIRAGWFVETTDVAAILCAIVLPLLAAYRLRKAIRELPRS